MQPSRPLLIYPRVFPVMSPVRLRAVAHLYGVETVPLEHARVMEIGAGIGNNLLTFALAYPDAQVLCLCDHADEKTAADVWLESLRIENMHVAAISPIDLDPEQIGLFDYILIPRQFSTLPVATGLTLLESCVSLLSPLGIVCVGHEVYPGAKVTEIVRDGVMMHGYQSGTAEEVMAAATSALSMFTEGRAAHNPMGQALRAAALTLEAKLEAEGVHALENTHPSYLVEFLEVAAQAGLSCVGDAEPQRDLAAVHGTHVAMTNSILGLGQPNVLRRQYLDFSTGRALRHSLLVAQSRQHKVCGDVELERLMDLSWASSFVRTSHEVDINTVEFSDNQGKVWLVDDLICIGMLDVLAHAWPAALPFSALAKEIQDIVPTQKWCTETELHARMLAILQGWFQAPPGAVYYCFGRDPYYCGTKEKPRLVAGCLVEGIQLADRSGSSIQVHNLWGQRWLYELSEMEKKLAKKWDTEGFSAQTLSAITGKEKKLSSIACEIWNSESVSAPVQGDVSRVFARLLSVLNHHGMIMASSASWAKVLHEALEESQGQMWYWHLYISALARFDLCEVKSGKSLPFNVPPQIQRQFEKSIELMNQGHLGPAETILRTITEKYRQFPETWLTLANCLHAQNKMDEALAPLVQATWLLERKYSSYQTLFAVLLELRRIREAEAALRRALALGKELRPQADFMAGTLFKTNRNFLKAQLYYERQLLSDPNDLGSVINLGDVFLELGDHESAEALARSALDRIDSSHAKYQLLFHNYLYASNYSLSSSAEEIYSRYQEFDHNFFSSRKKSWKPWKNRKTVNRKLKIGYVSPDFCTHAVSKFLMPLLENHDRSRFEVYAYANLIITDVISERYKRNVDHWRIVKGLDDRALAETIRADEIDILIDVSGHTAGNRLGVFALKPAPVSLSWMGFGYTTGLSAIDYFLADEELCPIGSDHLFSEKPWRLPDGSYIYRADWDAIGDVGELPTLAADYITFGSLTRSIRVNPLVIKAWCTIMQAVPRSRLLLNSHSYAEGQTRNDLVEKFAAYGIESDRLVLMYQSPPWDSLRMVDIGLDCFPHNSGTTLFDMLCMGIPFVTLAGRPSVGRIGSSILKSLGRPEWIASEVEDYVAKAVELASNVRDLSILRSSLRSEVKHSNLMDEPAFARKVEDAYHSMFKLWIENSAGN